MLLELAVENYAVIERLRVRFHPGLNLLTGETGSGKSIVVDALGLLFGARASTEMVRTGAASARVSGVFEVAPSAGLSALLEQAGIESEDGELLIEREIQSNGKSRVYAASRPATAAFLRDLAPYLGDIHGQHDQQQLFSSEVQLTMLDAFSGAGSLLEETAAAYRQWCEASAELEELGRSEQEKLRLKDLWEFQRSEIEAIAPQPGEDVSLDQERRVLRNMVRLEETGAAAYASLYEDPESVTARLHAIRKRLDELARIDEGIRPVIDALEQARPAVEEAADALRHYLGRLEADPGRLDAVESRLAALDKLKRKYGATVEEILTFLEVARAGLEQAETSGARLDALRTSLGKFAAALEGAAAKLSRKRRDAAKLLARRVETELASLAMEKTRLEIRITQAPWSEHGADAVEFLLSANPGEEPKPLEKIASGGELSRVALALKTCTEGATTSQAAPRTLVFDEVDAGVGGSAAEAVGRRLRKLSRSSQVLCVTHLPQIAGFADHHYYVEKHTASGRTTASIEELDAPSRTREIGRMLSGERVTPEALRHAQQLQKLASE